MRLGNWAGWDVSSESWTFVKLTLEECSRAQGYSDQPFPVVIKNSGHGCSTKSVVGVCGTEFRAHDRARDGRWGRQRKA